MGARIVLSGCSAILQGKIWESERFLRIGKQDTLDIVLPDDSVSRFQAEIYKNGQGWRIRDLANNLHTPSYLNDRLLQGGEARLCIDDVLQFGKLKLKVTALEEEPEKVVVPQPAAPVPPAEYDASTAHLKTSGAFVKVQAASHRSWDEALEMVAADPQGQAWNNQHLLTLLRAGYHLRHIASLDELLHSVLRDALKALEAQRGAIVLADSRGNLQLRSLLSPCLPEQRGQGYSRTLAQRCFVQGESLLCRNVATEVALLTAGSVRRGAMSSIICAVLRSPRKRLGVLHLDRGPLQEPFTLQDFYIADAIAASVAVGIESALMVEQQREEFIQSVTSLARTVEMRDQYTGDHTRRVTEYAALLGREVQLSLTEMYHLQIGTPLHDIGKIGIDDAILRKPGRLTDTEFAVMKTHTVKGAAILQSMTSLEPMLPIVRHHHERWDGRGYPDGLFQEQIPQIARVVAVADAFDAMTSDRPYRRALTASAAFEELHRGAGTHFDPLCVQAFLKLRTQIEDLLRS